MKTHLVVASSLFLFAACKKAEPSPSEAVTAKPQPATATAPAPAPDPAPAPAPAAVVADPPTAKQAVAATKAWLDAFDYTNPGKMAAILPDGFQLYMEHSHQYCATELTTVTSAETRDAVAKCLSQADLDLPPLKKKVTEKLVQAAVPETAASEYGITMPTDAGSVWLKAAHADGHEYAVATRVAMRDGKPTVTGAVVEVMLVDD